MIKRSYAIADTQITNAKQDNLIRSGNLSNMGKADSGEIFAIFNSNGISTQSYQNDESRLLFKFDIAAILADTEIPTSTAGYYLRLFNVKHDSTLPRNFILVTHPITKSWEEGDGLDIDNYLDTGSANWLSASSGVPWQYTGSDFNATYSYSQTFEKGHEDLEIDITSLVSVWKSGTLGNNGIVVKLTSSQEYTSQSYYKKSFSMRGTQYWFSRPCIEIRWQDARFDDRNNSYYSSTFAPGDDNLNSIYLYNKVRGQLVDIPGIGTGSIYVSLFTGSTATQSCFNAAATGSWVATGTYRAQFYSTYTGTLYDFWHSNVPVQIPTSSYFSSTIVMKNFLEDYYTSNDEFIITMPNLKGIYNANDKSRLDLVVRKRAWRANVYTTMTEEQSKEYIKKAYYQVRRALDSKIVVDFGSGSLNHTLLSYDKDGNYFNLNMNLFEPDYQYEIAYVFDIEGKKILQKDKFKFRIQREET